MRITIIAFGSRGDVEPYVALGKGLHDAGHGVRLVSHENFESLAGSQGLEFWPAEGSSQDVAQSQEMRDRICSGSLLAVLAQMAREAERAALSMARAGLAAAQGVDALLAGIGGLFTGLALAEKLRLPFVQAYYLPFTPTRAYPNALFPRLPASTGALNRLTYHLARQMMWQGFRRADGLARREVLDLPAAPLRGPRSSDLAGRQPILYGFSPAVIPPAPDWDERTHVTGYWFLDPPGDWSPPPALVEFLAAGPPPVFAGFGSMPDRAPEETAAIVVEALARTGQRAVLQAGWGGLRASRVPDSVYMLDSAPFAWLFPRMAAVVHHGGAGTTAAGLRAGVPSIVVPFFADQFFWGQRVAELGVGPAPIARKKLTADRLAHAIQQAVGDQALRERALALGTRIRAEDGVGQAVRVIDGLARAEA